MSAAIRRFLYAFSRTKVIERSGMIINARVRRFFTFGNSDDLLYAFSWTFLFMRTYFFSFDGHVTRIFFRFAMRDI